MDWNTEVLSVRQTGILHVPPGTMRDRPVGHTGYNNSVFPKSWKRSTQRQT
jgi:hypothetical protein